MLDAGGPWILVDLSNVCRDERLCRPGRRADLEAFDLVAAGLQAHPGRFGHLRAVADRSLFRLLEPDDKARLRRLVADKVVVETPVADDTLITAAFSPTSPFRGALIVSADGFADYRPQYPEIQGSSDRFLGWRRQPNGGLTMSFRNMGEFTHMRISRKVEQGEFKQRRILNTTVRDRAVRDRYRCTAPGCLQAQLWPDWLPQLPEYDRRDDCFRCPGCGARLERAGPRPASTQVVVYANRDEACRIILEAGQRVVLGRDDRSGCVGLSQYLADDITAELSRAQAALTMREGAILVEDLGSKNGTWLETRKGPRERRALSKGNPVVLDRRVRVRLASDVILELSGRRNPFDGVRLGSRHTRIDIESDRTRTGG